MNILKKMRCILIQRRWIETSSLDYLPFQDKVLNLKTREVIEHSPSFRFTWSLPRNYDENANDWSLIKSWLDEATGGKQDLKDIILCFCNATLKGRHELQKFLLTIGHGGTGKTTLQNLTVELIGERNTNVSSLREFNGNRFEPANSYGKRLTIFPDEDKHSGNLDNFKSLTGGGYLRVERKGKDVERSYKNTGMVMMSANYSPFVSEQSSAIARRTIIVPFNQTPKEIDHLLFEKLTSQLNAFTNYLLSIPDEFVTKTLLGTQKSPDITFMEWEQRMMTDSVSWWLNDYVIRDENSRTPVGNNKNEWLDVGGIGNVKTLYGSYHKRCSDAGKMPLSVTSFSKQLKDLCCNILGWREVNKHDGSRNNGFTGLCLREEGKHDHILTLEEKNVEELGSEPSIVSTIESQQGFKVSTIPSTNPPFNPPLCLIPNNPISDTTVNRDESTSDSPTFIKSGDLSGDLVEGMVDTLNPCQIRIVEGMEGLGHNPSEFFNEGEKVRVGESQDSISDSFKIGDIVTYVGERYALDLNGMKLKLAVFKDEQWSCQKPNDYFTTWLYPEELKIAKVEDYESTG